MVEIMTFLQEPHEKDTCASDPQVIWNHFWLVKSPKLQNRVCRSKIGVDVQFKLAHNTLKLHQSLTFCDFSWHSIMPWKAQVASSKSALRASSPLVTSLTLKWIVSLRASSNGDLSQFMLDGLQLLSEPPFPSGLEAKLFWFQVKLLNWVPSCCSFQHLFVVYTMNWNPPCIVSKILGTTFMQSSLCVTQQDERYYSCVTRSSKNGSNNHWLRFLTVSRQMLLLWMSLNC